MWAINERKACKTNVDQILNLTLNIRLHYDF